MTATPKPDAYVEKLLGQLNKASIRDNLRAKGVAQRRQELAAQKTNGMSMGMMPTYESGQNEPQISQALRTRQYVDFLDSHRTPIPHGFDLQAAINKASHDDLGERIKVKQAELRQLEMDAIRADGTIRNRNELWDSVRSELAVMQYGYDQYNNAQTQGNKVYTDAFAGFPGLESLLPGEGNTGKIGAADLSLLGWTSSCRAV
jgi:hypothetical protein